MAATWAISDFSSISLACSAMASTAAATAVSMPRLRPIGLAPAATLRRPSRTSAWASTVAVVVPSPAMSLVLVATSFTSWAPMFSKGSSSSISRAMDTPSLVIVGAPNFLSSTTLRPFGPRVTLTASASCVDAGLEGATGFVVELQDLGHVFSVFVLVGLLCRSVIRQRHLTMARTSRAWRISRSSPSTVISVPPYLE